MAYLDNFLLGLAKGYAKIRGSEPAIILDNNKLEVKFINPNSDSVSWEDNWNWGNIFIKNYGNPMKVKIKNIKDKYEGDLIPSKKYKTWMQMNVIERAFNTKGTESNMLMYALIGAVVLNIVLTFAVLGLLRG